MSDLSRIHDLERDPPVDLSGGYNPTRQDRRFIDNQVQDITSHLFDSCVLSVQCGNYFVDASQPSTAPLAIGDVVCGVPGSLGGASITKAVPGALALSGAVAGVVVFGGAPGGYARVARAGIVPNSVTGLGTGVVSLVRVSGSGRLERVGSFSGSDFVVGICDTAGNLTFHAVAAGSAVTSLSGQVTGLVSATVVEQINGATLPIAGGLTTGNGLYVSGPSALTYSALQLDGGPDWVTGRLPADNIELGTEGQFLRTLSGAVVWSTVAIGTGSISPGTVGQVLTTIDTDPGAPVVPGTSWALLTDVNIASGAEIAVAKLANGTDGDFLTTVGTGVAWTGTIPFGKIAPGAADTALVTNGLGTAAVWAKIVDANIDAAAEIAVTKLGNGADGQVVVTVGTAVQWGTVTPAGIAPGTVGQVFVTVDSDPGAPVVPAAAWGQITNAGVAANAAIEVAKLEPGVSNGMFLVTLGGVAQWTAVTVGTSSIAPGTVGQWLVTVDSDPGAPVVPASSWVTPLGDWDGAYDATKVRALTGTVNVVAMHGTTILWDAGLNGVLTGADVTGAGATAPDFTLQAPNATGTGATTGAALNLSSGTGATRGALNLQSGGTTVLQVTSATKITLYATATLTSGTAVPSAVEVDGSLYTRTGGVNGSLWGRENGVWARYLTSATLPPSANQFQNVATLTDLTALVVTSLLDGTWCWVREEHRVYILETSAATPSVDDDIYASTTAGRVWMGQP